MAKRRFIYFSSTANVGSGKKYATEQAKWNAEIAPKLGTDYASHIIFREATGEIMKGSVKFGLSTADAARITALETRNSQYVAAKQLMADYAKAASYSAVASTDTIAQAIGKVEAGVVALQTEIGNKKEGEIASTGMYKYVDDAAADAVAKVVANAPSDFDTLKEVSDWIKSDTTGAAKMQSQIATLTGSNTTVGSVAKAEKDAKSYADRVSYSAAGNYIYHFNPTEDEHVELNANEGEAVDNVKFVTKIKRDGKGHVVGIESQKADFGYITGSVEKSQLATGVKTSLGKADSAVQTLVGNDFLNVDKSAGNANQYDISLSLQNITVNAGTVPAWNENGSVKTAAVVPTVSASTNGVAEAKNVAAAIKAYCDAAIAQVKAELEAEMSWIEL